MSALYLYLLSIVFFPCQSSENYTLWPSSADRPGYFEHLPDAYSNTETKKFPLILFLHGKGEQATGAADDLNRLLRWGPPRIIRENSNAYKKLHPYRFIILAPQLPESETSWTASQVNDFLNFAMENYRINPDRVYLTGISLGGNGVWNYASSPYNEPNRLAAIAPVAAWGDPETACMITSRRIPVWAYHGLQDNIVPVSAGRKMFEALADCGKSLSVRDYRYTTFNTGHNSWTSAYGTENLDFSLYDWFLKFSLPLAQDTVPDTKIPAWQPPRHLDAEPEMLASLPSELHESSGLVTRDGVFFWSQNDSGNSPVVYQLDANGMLSDSLRITNAQNVDWEDLALDKEGNLYIADIGNNFNIRKKLTIYKVNSSDLTSGKAMADEISFTYEDQKAFPPAEKDMHYDAESLIHFRDSLYIFTKNRTEPFTGYTHIYRLPDAPGDYTAQLVDSLKLGEGIMTNFWLTGADVSPSGEQIALLSHDKLWILSCLENRRFSEGQIVEVRLNSFTQKESVSFADETSLYLTDERIRNVLGGNIYRVVLPAGVSNSCD